MTSAVSNIVFDDIFSISAIDRDGKKFDRVSRLYAHSKNYDMDLTLDYNVELFPLAANQNFAMALSTSLARGAGGTGTTGAAAGVDDMADEEDKDRDVWRPDGKGRRGLEEDYDYVMYGRVYKFDQQASEKVTAYASFGGLLMSLSGHGRHVSNVILGDPVYLLMRK